MAFSTETVSQALKIKNDEVNKQKLENDTLLQKIRLDNPRLDEIDTSLAKIGSSIIGLSLSGKTEELEQKQKESLALCKEKEQILKKAEFKPFGVLCPVCSDTNYSGGKLCICVKEIAKELSLKEFYKNIPEESFDFKSFKLEYYPEEARKKMQSIYEFSLNYAENFTRSSGNVLFTGKCGLGKTHLSLAIAKLVLNKGYAVVYGPAQNLFSEAEKEHFSYGSSAEKTDTLLGCDLLIIDDLGTEFLNSFTSSLFYNIVNTRLLNSKPTVINTNLDFEELTARYSARITSRFIGEYTIKQFLGNDIRQLKAVEKLKKK